ncbi:hypothetical protein JOC73_003068, partial [Alkaliphilus hydrothermalis]|nr:hypothetical protein [Alkaliphilus hydrothermalis]
YLMARYYDAEIGRFISRDGFHGLLVSRYHLISIVMLKTIL